MICWASTCPVHQWGLAPSWPKHAGLRFWPPHLNRACFQTCRYDRQRCEVKAIKDMQLLAAMAPPGGGRSAFSQRVMAVFSSVNMTQPNDAQLRRIFSAILHTKLAEFNDEVLEWP